MPERNDNHNDIAGKNRRRRKNVESEKKIFNCLYFEGKT